MCVATKYRDSTTTDNRKVSIPGGFSCALRPHMCQPVGTSSSVPVSIPGGFSCALRLPSHRAHPSGMAEFQSLAGFLVRCDGTLSSETFIIYEVSIPGGFSCALRRDSTAFHLMEASSFNPWRVFLCVATTSAGPCPGQSRSSFNPWRVFLCVATP